MQLLILRLGPFKDRNVRVSIFPEGEEILVGDPGFGGISLQNIGAAETKMRERTDWFVKHDAGMLEDSLELGCGFPTLMQRQIGFAAHKNRVHAVPAIKALRRLS